MGTIRPCHCHTYREKMFSRWQLLPLYASFWSTSSTSCQELCCPWYHPLSTQLFISRDLSLRGPHDPTASPRCTLSLPAHLKSLSSTLASVPWTLHTVSCESLVCDRNCCGSSEAKQEVCFLFSAPCFWYPKLWFLVRAELSDADFLFMSSHENLHLQYKSNIKYEITAKLDTWNLCLSVCGKCQNNKSLKGTNSLLWNSCQGCYEHTLPGCVQGKEWNPPMPSLWLNIFVIENSDISDKVISRTNRQRIWDGSVHCREGSEETAVASRLHRAQLLCEIHTELRSQERQQII